MPGALASFTGLKLTEPSRSYHSAGLVQKAIVGNKKVDMDDPCLPRWCCECDRGTSDLALKRGVDGFTLTDRDQAFAKLRELREHRVP